MRVLAQARCFLLIFLAPLFLSGCLVMNTGGSANFSDIQRRSTDEKSYASKPHTYTMRGLMGIFSQGMDKLARELREKYDHPAAALSYLESNKLITHIESLYQGHEKHPELVLVGHSYGADGQVKIAHRLAEKGIIIDKLILLDNTLKGTIPSNVREVYQITAYSPGLSQAVFGWGKKYQYDPESTKFHLVHVKKDLGVNGAGHFTMHSNKKVMRYIESLILEEKA